MPLVFFARDIQSTRCQIWNEERLPSANEFKSISPPVLDPFSGFGDNELFISPAAESTTPGRVAVTLDRIARINDAWPRSGRLSIAPGAASTVPGRVAVASR
jgi:hypothetical protein